MVRGAMRRLVVMAWLVLPGSAGGADLPQTGDYLPRAYIEPLRKTLSPLQAARDAARDGLPQLVSVEMQGHSRRIALIWDWHRGEFLAVVQQQGTIRRELAWGIGPHLALRVIGTNEICLTAPKHAQQCYEHVGSAAGFAARTVLVGKFADDAGRVYEFGSDGTAHFPGFDAPFTLVLDQVADRYDCFAIGQGGQYIAFRRTGATLTLFRLGPPLGEGYQLPDFSHPIVVLHTIRTGRAGSPLRPHQSPA